MLAVVLALSCAWKEEESPIKPSDFSALAELIKPKPGTSDHAWLHEIPWLTDVHEARVKAAAEDKPIVILKSANSPPLGIS
jgi:hypothetical protein